jgi:DNA processing protein
VIDREELAAWLRLLLTPGVGRDTARRLLAMFGGAQEVFAARAAALRQAVGETLAEALAREPDEFERQLAETASWLVGGAGRQVVTLGDAAYPDALLNTADPPLLLFAQGRVELLRRPSVAIVGSRNASPQGLDNARAFAAHLSGAGFTIVSGMALGIDGAAHEGALGGAGSTIAVVGTGLDRIYPSRHRDLAHRIAEHGVIVGEFPIGTPPLPPNFPQRNRVIAGLACGTLVVEAAVQSGSLITARLAAEAGREVFAIPGSIHAPQSRGCHALIKQGAKLVESAADVLDELRPGRPQAAKAAIAARPPGPTAPTDALLDALGHDPATLDALMARTGWAAADLNARLLELELDAQVVRLPGGLFQRRAPA